MWDYTLDQTEREARCGRWLSRLNMFPDLENKYEVVYLVFTGDVQSSETPNTH